MSKVKVSWLLCIGRLVSKTDDVMHFARLVKQASVDLGLTYSKFLTFWVSKSVVICKNINTKQNTAQTQISYNLNSS